MKINANFQDFAAVHFDPSKYIASPSYGVNRFMLDRIGQERARATTIVQYKPNSKFPSHTHVGGEEFIVLRGTFRDEWGAYPAGSYVRNPIGSQHAPWVDQDGCTILVKLLQMSEQGESSKPWHKNIDQLLEKQSRADLFHNKETGERVQALKLHANETVDQGSEGGEEFFVLTGSLIYNEEEFGEWGWLRFPSDTTRCRLSAGNAGAIVYCKSGHLTEKARGMEKIQIQE